jgi:hypothetical protein
MHVNNIVFSGENCCPCAKRPRVTDRSVGVACVTSIRATDHDGAGFVGASDGSYDGYAVSDSVLEMSEVMYVQLDATQAREVAVADVSDLHNDLHAVVSGTAGGRTRSEHRGAGARRLLR